MLIMRMHFFKGPHLHVFIRNVKNIGAPDHISVLLHLHIPCNNHGLVDITDSWSGFISFEFTVGMIYAATCSLAERLRRE